MDPKELFRSSSSRVISLRTRRDLKVRKEVFGDNPRWIVHLPVSGKYLNLAEREYALLTWLRDEVSLDELKQRFEAAFPDAETTVEDLHRFVLQLQQQGLLEALTPGDGARLVERSSRQRWKALRTACTNPLSIRLPGISPGRLLQFLLPFTGWFFTIPCAVVVLTAIALTAVWIGLHAQQVVLSLPDWRDLAAPSRLLSWLFLLAGMKCLHELGHALMCERLGARCKEIGVMFLLFSPCLYCNVTDAWQLPSKWRRAAVALGGIYVELTLATLGAWIWWWSKPGLIHDVALQMAISGSITTLLFNANPLMKYDGYYCLCDLWEIPDLSERSKGIAQSACLHVLGLGDPEHTTWKEDPQFNKLLTYGLLSGVYRWVMMVSISLALYRWAEAFQLDSLALPLLSVVWLMNLSGPVVQAFQSWLRPVAWDERPARLRRLWIGLGWGALLLAFAFLPLPTYVTCRVELRPLRSQPVYVQSPGLLKQVRVQPGERVAAGQVLAELSNAETELAVAEAERQLALARQQLATAKRTSGEQRQKDPRSLNELEDRVRQWEELLGHRCAELERLRLTAPIDGQYLPPERRWEKRQPGMTLVSWQQLPTDGDNRGCQLAPGDIWGSVAEPNALEVWLAFDAADDDLVVVGQSMRMQLACRPWQTLTGTLRERAAKAVNLDPRANSMNPEERGSPRAQAGQAGSKQLFALASLQSEVPTVPLHSSGQGQIQVGYHSCAWRLWRLFHQTFHAWE